MQARLRKLTAIGLLLFAGVASGCATVVNPVTGKREWSTMSPAQEKALGEQAAAQVEAEIGLVADPALVAYVDALGQRLAARSPRTDVEYHFNVADMEEPNAFALPGGWIYVSRGLLAISNSEAELANVLGHEIGHVAARHADQRQTRATGVGILTALGTILAGAAAGGEAAQSVAQLGQVAGQGYIASYGRDQERQADDVGQRLAAATGWDPDGMARFLHTLERESVLRTGATRRPTFLDSHPLTAERVATTRERASGLATAPARPIARSRADFLSRLAGLLVGPDPAQGVFRDGLFLHPGLDFALEFPPGWQTRNTPQAVGAVSPQGDGQIVLELQGPSGDPGEAARAFAQQNRLMLTDGRAGQVGGWRAYRAAAVAQVQGGSAELDLTWIAHPAATFRLTGVTARGSRANLQRFLTTARSFRPLTRSERAAMTEQRLRVVTARRGESLAALSRRTGNRWSLEQTAVANGLDAGATLASGTPVKVAVEVPYRP